jgi:hypothetical protein
MCYTGRMKRPPPPRPYDRPAIQAQVLARIESGMSETGVAGLPGYPSRRTLRNWAQADPGFAARLAAALAWGKGARRAVFNDRQAFDEARAADFLAGVRLGIAVRALARRPEMPNRELVCLWRARRPDFAAALADAMRTGRLMRDLTTGFDQAVADRIIVRLSRGETVKALRVEGAIPGRQVMRRWTRQRPDFASAVAAAMAFGRRARMARRRTSAPEVTEAIEQHIIAGGSLHSAGQAPGMPCSWTLYGWMRHRPAFARAVREAESFRDMMLADQALEVVDAMTAAGWQADVNRLSALRLRAGQLSAGARRRD